MLSEICEFVKIAAYGGVSEIVQKVWNEENERAVAKNRAFLQLCQDLEFAGYLTVEQLPTSGDYRRLVVRLVAIKGVDEPLGKNEIN